MSVGPFPTPRAAAAQDIARIFGDLARLPDIPRAVPVKQTGGEK